MSTHQIEILILASLTAVTCSLPGVFLVLGRASLMSDAISHAILLGIVLAFFITKSLVSVWLIVGAAIVGVLTVSLTELIIQSRKLKKDAAIGLVFPLFFSIAVILINKYLQGVHLDAECVIFGEIAFTPFDRLMVNGQDFGPQALWVISAVLILNILFISLFYKELKLATFDAGLATTLGFYPVILNYILMSIVSVTAVASFESVGSILVVALMITPPATAYLLTDRLSKMIIISALVGVLSAVGGYLMAYTLDASISGSIATFAGILFMTALIFAPDRGLLSKIMVQRWKKWNFASDTLAVHLLQSEHTHTEETERVVSHMNDHMLWSDGYTSEAIAQAIADGLIKKEKDKLSLTPLGREKAKDILSKE